VVSEPVDCNGNGAQRCGTMWYVRVQTASYQFTKVAAFAGSQGKFRVLSIRPA
jgi:hypothetical protein